MFSDQHANSSSRGLGLIPSFYVYYPYSNCSFGESLSLLALGHQEHIHTCSGEWIYMQAKFPCTNSIIYISIFEFSGGKCNVLKQIDTLCHFKNCLMDIRERHFKKKLSLQGYSKCISALTIKSLSKAREMAQWE